MTTTTGNINRRALLAGVAALGSIAATGSGKSSGLSKETKDQMQANIGGNVWDVVVVGAGVFGAWTATHLQRLGKRVLLVDAGGPANARASSGGETRMTRTAYGADAIYSQMATQSLEEWKALSERAALPLFHQTGVLMFFQTMVDYAKQSIEVHKNLDLPLEVLDASALATKFPQVDFAGVEFGLHETEFGVLMARRSVLHLVEEYVQAGGAYARGQATAPEPGGDGHSLKIDGEPVQTDAVVYACGPWLPKLFPELLGPRFFVTRQAVAFVAPPAGNDMFSAGALPGWADFNGCDLYYGFADIEGRGLKIAHDQHGPAFDPDMGDRRIADGEYDRLRTYMERRFPALAGQPFVGERVCQYTNSSNGDFLIDKHPDFEQVYLLGGGSGHGFKHGPEVGRTAAAMITDTGRTPDQRFSLASKETTHHRAVI